jgi:gamma-glutamyltranspeptidase/glutathione hydrolase
VIFGIADAQPRDIGDEVAFPGFDHDDKAILSNTPRKETGMIVRRILCISAVAIAFALPAAAAPMARHHMIVTDSPFATEAGRKILRAGGSAVDAAIAAQAMLTLVEPESTGIGGGAFMVLFDPAQKKVTTFDGREMAPASATPGMFLDASGKPRPHSDAIPGGLSVGVPGDVAMMWLAHKKYGRLAWAKLFAPAIALSEKGFLVTHKLAAELRQYPQIGQMPDIRAYFYHPDGTPYAEGEILKNPELAKSLAAIAKNGPKAFYEGPIAQAIVDKVQHAPVNQGGMTLADLKNYVAKERAPVCGTYRAYRLCSMGPPSSGGVAVIQILDMLEHSAPKDLQPGTLSQAHLFTQASRLAFADRAKYLADSDFIPVPVAGLTDRGYTADRAKLIDPAKDMGQAVAGVPPVKHAALDYAPQRTPQLPGTSHLSIVDDRGEAVAMTTTVESILGSEMMAGGFILNNQLTDFSFDPMLDGKPVANAPAPGKRPLSAMSPTIVFGADGKFKIATGSPGGPAIIDYVAQSIIDLIDGNETPKQAAAEPHVLNLNSPTIVEKGTAAEALIPQLTAMGHHVVAPAVEQSGVNIIERVKGGYDAAADPRRDGNALGD